MKTFLTVLSSRFAQRIKNLRADSGENLDSVCMKSNHSDRRSKFSKSRVSK